MYFVICPNLQAELFLFYARFLRAERLQTAATAPLPCSHSNVLEQKAPTVCFLFFETGLWAVWAE